MAKSRIIPALAVIPARLGSKRFPGKALALLDGRPLIYYPWHIATRSKSIDRVVIATDSTEIARVARDFGAEVIMTSRRAHNGTERVAEVAAKIPAQVYINIQGDTILVPSQWLKRGLEDFRLRRGALFHTLVCPLTAARDLYDPSKVKVALSTERRSLALWFSRLPIPFVQDAAKRASILKSREGRVGFPYGVGKFWRHVGVYFYRREGLARFQLWRPGVHERAESLEQLRILENSERIGATIVRGNTISVDSPRDLKAAIHYL